MFFGFLLAFTLAAGPVELAPPPRLLTPAAAATALDRKIIAEIRERSQLMANLRHLSDEIGPRLTGTPALERANRWTAEQMKKSGVENVHLEAWEIPIGWERGSAQMRIVEPNNGRSLHVAAAGWTPGTDGSVTGPVVILDAKTKDDLAKYKGKLRNAVVLRGPPTDVKPVTDLTYGPPPAPVLPPVKGPALDAPKPEQKVPPKTEPKTPPKTTGKEDPPRPALADLRAFRRELEDFLKAEGAAAVLADAGKPHGLLITTGAWRDGDRGTPQSPLPMLFIAHEHYALLHRLATRPGGSPPIVEVNVSNRFVPGPVTVYNTVGEIRGSEKPDEFVVIGAHLDSWDLGTGTTDNGTGSSVVLEAARTFAALAKQGIRPKRTIRFVLFSGEEQGLHGSKQYVKKHKDEMPKTSAALVHDTGTGKVLGFGLQGRAAVRTVLEPQLGTLKELDGWKGVDLASMAGTDHLSFEEVGVPGFACRQDMDEYRLTHHTQSDTFDKAKAPSLLQGAQVLTITAMRVANLPDLLPRERPTPKKEEPKKGEPKKEEPKKTPAK